MATDPQLDRLLKAADPARDVDRDPTSDTALAVVARALQPGPAEPQPKRRRPIRRRAAMIAVALLVVSGAAAIATGRFDADPQAVAEACFADEGFEIDGRVEFWVHPRSGVLAFRPLVASPDGAYDIRTAPRPSDGRHVSLEERERVLARCIEQIRDTLDLPTNPPPLERELDAGRAAPLDDCLRDAGVLPWIDDLRLLEGLDGTGPIIEHTTDQPTGVPSATLRTAVESCLSQLRNQPVPASP